MSDQQGPETAVAVEWFPADGSTMDDLRQQADRLREADPNAEVNVVESQGILPIIGWVVAAIAIVALAREISDLVCRLRKQGVIIDARGGKVRIREQKELPGGTVVVLTAQGSENYNVCDGKVDLAALIKAVAA